MISFLEYLAETKLKAKKRKYYPYKLNRWKPGQKKRSIAMANSTFEARKQLKKKLGDIKRRNKSMFRKKKTKR